MSQSRVIEWRGKVPILTHDPEKSPLILMPVGSYQWQVCQHGWQVQLSNGYDIIVARGFVTDLASVPRIFWPIVPPYGKHLEASILHDFLCRNGWPRKTADREFLHAMKRAGVKRWRRMLMFWAVRAWAILSGKG